MHASTLLAGSRLIELVVVASDERLVHRVAARTDPQTFRVIAVDALAKATPYPGDPSRSRSLLWVAEAPPRDGVLRELLQVALRIDAPAICVLRSGTAPQLVSELLMAGLQDVLDLDELNSIELRRAVLAAIARGRAQRELAHIAERALLERDILATVAAATTPLQVHTACARGLLALGASHVACWQQVEAGFELLTAAGAQSPPAQPRLLEADAARPLVRCAHDGRAEWHEDAGEVGALDRALLGHPGIGSLGFVPARDGGPHAVVISISHLRLPAADELRAIERLCRSVGEALGRADVSSSLREELDADRRLLAVVSHDLRNPLSAVLLGARLLLTRCDGQTKVVLRDMERAALTAARLTLDLSTFTSGTSQLELASAPTQVFGLVSTSVLDAAARATRGRTVRFDQPPGDSEAEIDALRIEQGLGNLLSNAIRYAPDGSEIVVRGAADDHAVYIEVENESAPIDPSELSRLFEPDVRLSKVVDRGSVGLGLFIVARILDAHGGRVWLEQRAPNLVTFCVQIPRRRRSDGSPNLRLRSASRLSSPRPAPAALPAELSQLCASFRSPALAALLSVWAAARTGTAAPHPLSLDQSGLVEPGPDLVAVRISCDDAGAPSFTIEEVGARLERRLRGTIRAAIVEPTPEADSFSQFAAYRRCWQRAAPCYDYYKRRGSEPVAMERLLLPLSRDGGKTVTQLIGIVVFT